MKDITRIHIAKVSYDVELAAKKTLETYITTLEVYAQDTEVLQDIEIRITELLLERNVKQNNVISMADVEAIKQQLGDPKEFMADGDVIDANVQNADIKKKLYRNTDTAILGGVIAGLSSYFGLNALWTRLIFVGLSGISFGAPLLLYVLLWVLVPAAKSATDKLQMSGQPVTIAAIRQLNESEMTPNKTPAVIRRIATIAVGLGAIIAAVVVVTGVVYALTSAYNRSGGEGFREGWQRSLGDAYIVTLSFASVATALLIALFLLIAFAALRQAFTRRIWVTGLVIIALGLASFGVTIASVFYAEGQREAAAANSTVTRNITLPVGFEKATALKIQDISLGASVQYIVSDDHRAEIRTPRSETASISIEGTKLSLDYEQNETNTRFNGYPATITIYGPALASIETSATWVQYQSHAQSELSVFVKDGGGVSSQQSQIRTLNVTLTGNSLFAGEGAAITNVVASIQDVSSLSLGAVNSLTITAPTACAANGKNEVRAAAVNDTFVMYNDKKMVTAEFEDICTAVYSTRDHIYGDIYNN